MGLLLNLFIVIGSLVGIVFILRRKIPMLRELQETGAESLRQVMAEQAKDIVSSQKEKLRTSRKVKKTISAARTVAVKTERQTGELFERLRKKTEKHKEEFSDSYWDQVRKRKKKK